MSYRDHLEAQKKYIQTKKEARALKEERLRNPRPPKLDPPPAPTSKLLVLGVVLLVVLPLATLAFLFPLNVPVKGSQEGLTVWIMGTEEEFMRIKNWLEPEILANDLEWIIEHVTSRQDLVDYLSLGLQADLLVVESNLAEEIYLNQALAPLWSKRENGPFEDSFWPMWEPQPFRKVLGWIIPRSGHMEEARHLVTVLRQFAPPFRP
jgi:hypothetical protein